MCARVWNPALPVIPGRGFISLTGAVAVTGPGRPKKVAETGAVVVTVSGSGSVAVTYAVAVAGIVASAVASAVAVAVAGTASFAVASVEDVVTGDIVFNPG